MITVIDFEVFKYDWVAVAIDPHTAKKTVWHNDQNGLTRYYEGCPGELYAGYNIRNYDNFIFKAIMLGLNPKELNDFIISQGRSGWEFSRLFREIPMNIFDIMPNPPVSLKTLEAYMGSDIRETDVPFDIQRPLTDEEVEQTIKYCTHDVEQTIEVLMRRSAQLYSQIALVKMFNLPSQSLGKTEASITAEILKCRKRACWDEWNIKPLDCVRIERPEYRAVVDWYLNPENHDYSKKLIIDVAGVKHVFAWGGLHGAREKYHAKGNLLHVDVESYYPSMLVYHNLITRSSTAPGTYADIYHKRLELKRQGKKKEQAPYKKILNAASGAMKARTNNAYDPHNNNMMCVNGQLLLLDLIEKLERLGPDFELVQSNTDGLIVRYPDRQSVLEICHEWEARTKMKLAVDEIDEIWQGDVNNYIFRETDGKLERKGAYVKALNDLDYDLPIINKAIVAYLTEGTPVEKTVYQTDALIEFQKVVKVSSKYQCGWHNGSELTDKTFRVFASKNPADTFIGKCKENGQKPEKFANTPDRCFIENGDIKGVLIYKYPIDRQWYIELAKKRIREKWGIDPDSNKNA